MKPTLASRWAGGVLASTAVRRVLLAVKAPRPPQLSAPLQYAIVPAATIVTVAIQYALLPEPAITPFLFFFASVAVVSWLAGRGPGLLTVLLSALVGNYLFIVPYREFSLSGPALTGTSFFLISATIVGLLCASFRDAALEVQRTLAEHQQAEEALAESESKLRAFFALLPVGVSIVDKDRKISDMNQALERILGLSKESLLRGEHTRRRYIRTDGTPMPAEEFPSVRAVEEQKEVLDVEVGVVKEDDTTIWTSVSAAPLPGYGAAIVTADITERKRAEEALRESEERYRTLFASVTEGFTLCRAIYDESGRLFDLLVLEANPSAEQANGLKREDFVGKTWRQLWPGAEQYWWDVCDQVILHGKDARYENYAAIHDRWYEVHHFSAGKDLMGTIFTDITERRWAEAERERLVAELQQQAHELAVANKELEDFSYSVAHDLRAPLRAIDGFSHILFEQYAAILPAEARRYLEVVGDNARMMGQLVDSLLRFSRLSRQPLTREAIAPADLAREVLGKLLPKHAGRRVEVSIGDLPGCLADRALLRQVFTNLLANALEFTRTRGVAMIEIGCREEGGRPVYFVKDNGVGFDMRDAKQLFEPFQRLHPSEDYEGIGIGLAIVKRIVQRHGGSVWAEAALGEGATFCFTL